MADTTNGAGTLGQKIEFIQNHVPAVELGKYDIKVEQSISVGGKALDGSPFRSAPQSFVVTGARFSLKPEDVYEAAEKPESSVLTLGQLKQTSTARFPSITLESDQTDDDKVTVIDVKASVLQNILPAGADLPYLAHVRQGTDDAGQPTGDEFSVVICNRLPVNGGISTVHLVSLEGRYQGDAFDLQGAQGDELVRLVSLQSWSFACLDEQQSFKGLLTKIDHDPGTVRLPDARG
jgi:hypothetical protein